jgi:hypothetical protein
MSISSIAQESTLRLTPPPQSPPTTASIASAAGAAATAATAAGATADVAMAQAHAAAQSAQGPATTTSAVAGPLALLVTYIPTETITVYVAIQAALGDLALPADGKLSDANFASRWAWVWIMTAATILLTVGLSYRSQKNANAGARYQLPYFDVVAAGAAFLVWALSLPTTPLRDFSGYDYTGWNSVIILGGTVVIAATAYVLGKTVTWTKVVDTGS